MTGLPCKLIGRGAGCIFFSLAALSHFSFAEDPDATGNSQAPVPAEAKSAMGGPPAGMSMHDMMRGPKTTALYPTMINSSQATPAERQRLAQQTEHWTAEGMAALEQGAAELSKATQGTDVRAIREAGAQIEEGLSKLESGLSTRHALEQGQPPSEIAIQWFKSQLQLETIKPAAQPLRILSMAPMQFFVCLLMLASIGLSLLIYVQRMRRAYQLLDRIDAGESVLAAGNAGEQDATSTILPQEGLLPIRRKQLCKLRLARTFPETPDVKTFRFVCCDHGPIPFSYLPGQFLTLTLPIDGKSVKRSYTISSSPTQGYYCEISVKREEFGMASRYLHDTLQEGGTLDVRGPSGKLTFTGKEAENIILIGGGVGMTPMMSVTRALADMGWKGEVILIVCCSDPDHFIFAAELEHLKARNLNLKIHVAMSRLQESDTVVSNESYGDRIAIVPGRLSKERLLEWIPNIKSRPRIHLCASPGLMDSIELMLADLEVPAEAIKTESFGSQEKPRARQSSHTTETTDKTVEFKQSAKTTTIEGDETILEAAERMGIDMNYSCRVGGCGECSVKIISGDVEMDVEDALEPNDKAANIILACQARPTSNVVIEA